MKDCFRHWDIDYKVSAVVSDNAANITAAIRLGGWRHVGCFAHQINLVVRKGLGEILPIIEKVKKLVEFYKRSTAAKYKLIEVQKQLNIPELMLKQDVETRWNSTFQMLDRLIKIKEAVVSATFSLRSDLLINSEEFVSIEQILPILKPFNDITTEMSTEKAVTLSKVIVYCKIMINHISKHHAPPVISTYLEPVQQLVKKLHVEIYKRFGDIESSVLHSEATVLDPRFKKIGFNSITKYEYAVSEIRRRTTAIASVTRVASDDNVSQSCHPDNITEDDDLWSEIDKEIKKTVPQNSTAQASIEVDRYLKEDLIPRKSDPLKWWYDRRNVYPNLYQHYVKKTMYTRYLRAMRKNLFKGWRYFKSTSFIVEA